MVNFIIISLLIFIAIMFLLNVSISIEIKNCLERSFQADFREVLTNQHKRDVYLEKEIYRLEKVIRTVLDHSDIPISVKEYCITKYDE